MSLLVHLPFMGDLRNNGLYGDATVTNLNATVNSAGKLGPCYQFGTGASQISISPDGLKNCKEMSVAFWFKIISWNSNYATFFQAGLGDHPYSGYVFGILRVNNTSRLMVVIGNGTNTTGASCYTETEFELDRWYHFAATYTPGDTLRKLSIYVDGELDHTYNISATQADFSILTHVTIGRVNNGNYQSNCLMNDFRIYDHTLSPKEVKEFSKGLVAHWKLDDFIGNENLSISTPKYLNHNAYNAYQFSLTENLVAGNKYTIQLWDVDVSHSEKTESQLGVSVYWGGGSVSLCTWRGTGYFVNGHADHLIMTFTAPKSTNSTTANAWLNIYNSVSYVAGTLRMSIGRWKLEKGEVATPWIPSSADDMYSDWGLDEIYDSSGYCHDGEQIGDVSVSSSTPRYLSGTHIESLDHTTNRYNVNLSCLKMPIEMITPEELTITFWGNLALGYGNGWQGVFSFSNSTWPTDYLAAAINQYDSNFCFNSSDGSSHVRLANNLITVAGEWHHYALTYDGKTCRAYRDGELKTSGTFSADTALGSFTHLFMGLSVAGSVWRKNTCDYSDVRVYATALSADDIKELYNTSASIDNRHNVYAREFVEV